nr:hypothetical protein [Tanacetum cinerariifolium]
MSEARKIAYAIDCGIWYSAVSSKMDQLHSFTCAQVADIQGEPYYQDYLEKVVKHQRYLAGEQGSDLDSPALKPTKATKKSKPSAPKADLRPPVPKPASSQQLEPKPAPAKPGSVTKQRKPTSSLRSVDESVDEGIPEKEPRVDDEEADVQRALKESLKGIYDGPRGLLPPVVIREPESGKYQPLPEKKSPVDQFILQRRTSTPIGSSGPNPSDDVASQPLPSPVGPNLEHMDLEVTDFSTQPHPEQIDEGFTSTAYPKVQENLKLTVEEQVILEEPASSTGKLSSLQHLAKDLIFGDLFFNDKPSEADNEKTTAETEAESMVSVKIKQDTSVISPIYNTDNEERLDSHGACLYTLENLDIPQQVSKTVDEIITDAVDWAIQAPLRNRFRDLPEADMKEKYMNRDHSEELLKDLAEARKKKKKRCDSPKTPLGSLPHQPPPPPPPADLQMDDDMAPDAQAHSSDDEDIRNAYIPKTSDMAMFMNWFCKRQGITKLKPQNLEGPAFKHDKVFHPNVIHL